jgi:cystathionine beta-lyase family protein involved in aluminum resistance
MDIKKLKAKIADKTKLIATHQAQLKSWKSDLELFELRAEVKELKAAKKSGLFSKS